MRFLYKTIFVGAIPCLAAAVLVILMLTGCATVGPDYIPPDTPVSATWHTQLKGDLNAEETNPESLAAWWTTLDDPELSRLIDRAVSGNLDLKKARARIREARARRGVVKADLFPTLDTTGSATWSHSSKDTGAGKTSALYSASFYAGWEVDISGGILTHLREIQPFEGERIFNRLKEVKGYSELKCLLFPIRGERDLGVDLAGLVKKAIREMAPGEVKTLNN